MSCGKVYSTREFQKLLCRNGYSPLENRGKGSHSVYSNGKDKVTINKNINPMIVRRLIKEHGLTR